MDKTLLNLEQGHLVAPSFLAADFLNIEDEVQWLEHDQVDLIHLDVMDGQFVPNISFGLPIIKAIRSKSSKPLDVHLMIERPDFYIEAFREVGADIISMHVEACDHLHRAITQIKEVGALAGAALNPHSNVDLLDDVLEELDMVVIMSVNPGFGGQKFITRALHKIERLKEKITKRGLQCAIEVDGGVNTDNAASVVSAGADILVAGSAIFKSDNRDEALNKIKQA